MLMDNWMLMIRMMMIVILGIIAVKGFWCLFVMLEDDVIERKEKQGWAKKTWIQGSVVFICAFCLTHLIVYKEINIGAVLLHLAVGAVTYLCSEHMDKLIKQK